MHNSLTRHAVVDGTTVLILLLVSASLLSAAELPVAIPVQYRVEPPQLPAADLSGDVGKRLLRLLDIQATRNIRWIADERRRAGITDNRFAINIWGKSGSIEYNLYHAMSVAYAFAILARCGEPGTTTGGTTRDVLEADAVALIKAVIETHPVSGSKHATPRWWPKAWALRIDHVVGMAAWLLWDKLDPQTQLLMARILEHDADRHLNDPAPAKLFDDTQGESNAWNAGGIALAVCMLQHHPHQAIWNEKAKELMLSAYATPSDVAATRTIDGKTLNQWLRAPNVFDDYTLENHGYVFPDYMAAVSEMVRSAICYKLAGLPVPEAVTFNADKLFQQLAVMTMPAGHYFYVQGTDYFSRRLDSILQIGNVLPLKPDPLLNGVFLRSLASIEKMAAERPHLPMNGWEGIDLDFGTLWGLNENYLIRRLFGSGGPALPDDQIDLKLAGVRVYNDGKFAIHRTARTISSFSWHTSAKASEIMGLTMPLDLDALCYPMPGSMIGEISESAPASRPAGKSPITVRTAKVNAAADGFGVLTELERCGGKVLQKCACVSLPDGFTVYIEDRMALQNVTIATATSGNLVICDDTRWIYQPKPRGYHGRTGLLAPDASALIDSNWVNVDDRMGFIALTRDPLHLFRVPGTPAVFRGTGTMYDTCRIEFVANAPPANQSSAPLTYDAGQRISRFAMVTCPNRTAKETQSLAAAVAAPGWITSTEDVFALPVGPYLVYANFARQKQTISSGGKNFDCDPLSSGWFPTAAASQANDGP